MKHARMFVALLSLAMAGRAAAAEPPAPRAPASKAAPAGEISKADADKWISLLQRMVDIIVDNQNDCANLASQVSSFVDANRDIIEKANAATRAGKTLPAETQQRTNALLGRMFPALQKCQGDAKVQAALDKLGLRGPGSK